MFSLCWLGVVGLQGSDAASLAFEALTEARESGADVLLMDTAGRLQNRTELMAELEKIVRVMRKVDAVQDEVLLQSILELIEDSEGDLMEVAGISLAETVGSGSGEDPYAAAADSKVTPSGRRSVTATPLAP